MSSFSVHVNLSTNSERYPFLLDVQTELLSNLDTRLVIPLIKREEIRNSIIRNLNPLISIEGEDYVLMTQQMAAVPRAIMGQMLTNAMFDRSEILTSIDFLITGI